MAYEAVIGLEVHAQLATASKLFCGCATRFGAEPNTQVCAVCVGLPGTLPVLNARAVELAIRIGLALGCTIREHSVLARKNYFYPDLPKGYQISQYELPLCEHGTLEIELDVEGVRTHRSVRIRRIHIEEDAAKNLHGASARDVTLVDYNRGGTPLVEIVSEPDLRSSAEAEEYLKRMREILMFAGVCDGNLEQGSFRCDANVSIRPLGSEQLGTRTELKNINSFRFVRRAVDYELARQENVVAAGGVIVQETRGYSEAQDKTVSQRSKEDAMDYRYFPDPDLPSVEAPLELVERVRAELPALPAVRRARYQAELGLTASDAAVLTSHPALAALLEDTTVLMTQAGIAPAKAGKRAANFIQAELLRDVRLDGLEASLPVTGDALAELLLLVESDRISGKIAKDVYGAMAGTGKRAAQLVAEQGLGQVSDEGALEAAVREAIASSPENVAAYQAGNSKVIGWFVGQVMKATAGRANPKLVNELLRKQLGGLYVTHVELSRTPLSGADYFAVEFDPERGQVVMLDQRRLPNELVYHRYAKPDEVLVAIRDMVVRGAPAIGIAAAYALALQARLERGDAQSFLLANGVASRALGRARPTAVNLAWAIARMGRKAATVAALAADERAAAMQAEAEAIHREDLAACKAMGKLGAEKVPDGATILTHCNAGALATGGYGTALGVIRAAHAMGKRVRVLADETRPYMQGARLTSWELHQDGIPVEVITDSMAAHFFQRGEIQFCVVGSDRIAANGDVANKIGTYGVAVLAHAHGVPFTVAAPWSTVDLSCPTGADIPIEERSRDEVARVGASVLVADGIPCRHPAFDVTPARLVTEVFTERGAFSPARGGSPHDLASPPRS